MDIATIIGILLAIGLVVGTIMSKVSIGTFIDPASMAIVGGGTFAALLICFPLKQALRILGVVKKAFFSKPPEPGKAVGELVKLAEVARRDGILSLETHLNDGTHDDFMVRGLRMAIDGQDRSVIETAMEQELEATMERHTYGKGLFDAMGKYAPAFGMLGTLIGLIIMLKNMDDPGALGPAMAIALITTFYGSAIANMFALPISDKLSNRSGTEIASKMLIIAGVLSIQAGDNPRVVQQKLMAFLDPAQRRVVEAELAR